MVDQATDRPKPQGRRPDKKWAWTHAVRGLPKEALSPLARHTMLALAEYADPDGSNCRPSYQTLADDMGRSRSVAAEGVKELDEMGWIERRRITVNGFRATLFVPLIPEIATQVKSGPPDDGTGDGAEAKSGPPDVHSPAHRTQPDQGPEQRGDPLAPQDGDRAWGEAMLKEGWGSKGRVTRKHVDDVLGLLDRGWTRPQVEDVVCSNLESAYSVRALTKRLDRVTYDPTLTYTKAMQDRGLLGSLGRLEKPRRRTSSRPRTMDEHGPTRAGRW